jgi:hypothetical protein
MLPSEAFEWIEENISAGSRILEFGSGDGSTRLAGNYEVWSVEHNSEWLGVAPVNYIHAPIVDNEVSSSVGEEGWYDPDSMRDGLPSSVSLIIIDGPTGDIGRTGVLAHLQILPETYYFLVDDIDREAEQLLLTRIINTIDSEVTVIGSTHLRSDGSPRQFAVLKLRR